jgi:FkbM family methyltransferase
MGKLNYLDIGAANFSLPQRWSYFSNRIQPILFEPDKRSFQDLNGGSSIVHNVALGEKREVRPFYLTRKPACSSIYLPNRQFLDNFPDSSRWDVVQHVSLEVCPLDDLQIEAHFIKIDTQGSELEILKGSKNTLNAVLGIEIEVSFSEIYQGQPLFGDVCDFLYGQGFEFIDFVSLYRYNRKDLDRTGQLAFADALFLRSPRTIKDNSGFNVEFFNIICNVYQKFDLIIL